MDKVKNMKKFVTIIHAIDPKTGELCKWIGPTIEAASFYDAERYCNENGLGYCEVDGEMLGEEEWDGMDEIFYERNETERLAGYLENPVVWN